MRVESEIKKWGNSLALRITGVMAEVPNFRPGTKVTVEVSEEGILVKPKVHRARKLRLPYSEQQLLQGLNATTAHADELAPLLRAELGD